MTRTPVVSLVLLLLLAAGGCASGPRHTVAESELALLGGRGLDAVETARQREAAAREALDARREEERVADREVRIADFVIRRDEADLEVARLQFEAAQETREAEAMLPANARRARAEHAVKVARTARAFRQAARDHAAARTEEAEAALGVALAEVEKAKLEAVLSTQETLTPKQTERRAAFDVQLAKAQAALAEEGGRAAAAASAMEAAEADLKAVAAAAP